MSGDDQYLFHAIQSGDEAAFEQLFFKYYEGLCHFACRYVPSLPVAEEFVQEAYVKVWEKRTQLTAEGSIRSYLYQTVKNNALDHIKHKHVVEKYEKEVELQLYEEAKKEEYESRLTREGFKKAAQDAIEELPNSTRQIYKLSRKDGFTYREIAKILDISIKTVESHISKALRILRNRLAPYLPALLILAVICQLAA